MIIPDIAAELRYVRMEAGLTQAQLSEKAKITRQTINYLENEERIPSLEMLSKIAEALGLVVCIKFMTKEEALTNIPWDSLLDEVGE